MYLCRVGIPLQVTSVKFFFLRLDMYDYTYWVYVWYF